MRSSVLDAPLRGADAARCGRLHVAPDLLLGEVQQARQHDQEDHDLEANTLPRLHMRLGRPHQERRHVLGVLRERLRRAVLVGDAAVFHRLRHRDGVAGEILVVGQRRRQLEARRRLVLVAHHQRGDVVDAVLLVLREHVEDEPGEAALVGARLGDHRHVRRHRVVARAGGVLVRPRRRKAVGRAAFALEHLALVVGAILDLVLAGDLLDLRLGIAERAGLTEVAERQQVEAVADRANLAIDLEAALQLRAVVGAERAPERPLLARRRAAFRRRPAQARCPASETARTAARRVFIIGLSPSARPWALGLMHRRADPP